MNFDLSKIFNYTDVKGCVAALSFANSLKEVLEDAPIDTTEVLAVLNAKMDEAEAFLTSQPEWQKQLIEEWGE